MRRGINTSLRATAVSNYVARQEALNTLTEAQHKAKQEGDLETVAWLEERIKELMK